MLFRSALALGGAAVLATTSAGAIAAHPRVAVDGVSGEIALQGVGRIRGAVSGEIVVAASTDESFEISGAAQCAPLGADLQCSGASLRFRLTRPGPFEVHLRGSRISLIASATGTASISAVGGSYTVGRRRRPLPPTGFVLRF